jgi:hypothetical protein
MGTEDDILKGAGRFFSKVGSAVRDAGSAAKRVGQQVTGIGRGEVRVELTRTRYAPGDDIKGTVTLALPEPVDAKRLEVRLVATQRTVDYHRTGGVRTVGTTNTKVYEQTVELAGPRRYGNEQVSFTVPIPKDAIDRKAPAPAGKIGDVARAVSSVIAPTAGPIQWKVTASLVIAFGRDLERDVDVVIDP